MKIPYLPLEQWQVRSRCKVDVVFHPDRSLSRPINPVTLTGVVETNPLSFFGMFSDLGSLLRYPTEASPLPNPLQHRLPPIKSLVRYHPIKSFGR
jgi:hypothetical protein